MPIFEYVCRDCGRRFETLVRGDRAASCPACEGANLDKQLSVFAVSAKGAAPTFPSAGPCGSCGDPRGPGACSLN